MEFQTMIGGVGERESKMARARAVEMEPVEVMSPATTRESARRPLLMKRERARRVWEAVACRCRGV